MTNRMTAMINDSNSMHLQTKSNSIIVLIKYRKGFENSLLNDCAIGCQRKIYTQTRDETTDEDYRCDEEM